MDTFKQYTMALPRFILFSALILPIYTGILKDANLFILLSATEFINHFLKQGFKILMGKDSYTFIGTGTRPKGATDSGIFVKNKLSTSYGMPSGHSAITTVFSTYLVFNRIIPSSYNLSIKILLTIIVLSLIPIIMYSRVKLSKVHTIQQTICGLILGTLIFVLYNKIETKIKY